MANQEAQMNTVAFAYLKYKDLEKEIDSTPDFDAHIFYFSICYYAAKKLMKMGWHMDILLKNIEAKFEKGF